MKNKFSNPDEIPIRPMSMHIIQSFRELAEMDKKQQLDNCKRDIKASNLHLEEVRFFLFCKINEH